MNYYSVNSIKRNPEMNSTDTVSLKIMSKEEALGLTCLDVFGELRKEKHLEGLTPLHCFILKNGVWTLSNLIRGKPSPDIEQISGCLELLDELLHASEEDQSLGER